MADPRDPARDPAAREAAAAKAREAAAAAAKETLAKQNEERKKANEEAETRMASSRPTPTQEENDLARLGAPPEQKEDDGSGPEPKWVLTRQVEATTTPAQKGSYQTRSSTPPPPTKPAA